MTKKLNRYVMQMDIELAVMAKTKEEAIEKATKILWDSLEEVYSEENNTGLLFSANRNTILERK